MVLLSVIYGNDPMLLFGGCDSMDVSLPACTAMVLGIVSFMSIPISISPYRRSGVLRRFRSTPLKPVTSLPGARGGVLPVGVASLCVWQDPDQAASAAARYRAPSRSMAQRTSTLRLARARTAWLCPLPSERLRS